MALRTRWTGRRAHWAKLVSQRHFASLRVVVAIFCLIRCVLLVVSLVNSDPSCSYGILVTFWRYLLGRLLTNYFPRSIWWWRVFTALTWRIARAVELTWRSAQGIKLTWRIERLSLSIYLERNFWCVQFDSSRCHFRLASNSGCVQFVPWIERAFQIELLTGVILELIAASRQSGM